MDRLDLTHAMMLKLLDNRLYQAPLDKDKIHKILDIGTGTGICKCRDSYPPQMTTSTETSRGDGNGRPFPKCRGNYSTLVPNPYFILRCSQVYGNDLSPIQPDW